MKHDNEPRKTVRPAAAYSLFAAIVSLFKFSNRCTPSHPDCPSRILPLLSHPR